MARKSESAELNTTGNLTAGPRWVSGKILARSILGDPEDFEALSREQTRVIRGPDDPSTPGTPTTTGGFDTMSASNYQQKLDPSTSEEIEAPDKEAEIRQALVTLSESQKKEMEEKIKKLKSQHIFQERSRQFIC